MVTLCLPTLHFIGASYLSMIFALGIVNLVNFAPVFGVGGEEQYIFYTLLTIQPKL